MSDSSLILGDIHGLIQVRRSQAKVTKYVKNRVLLTPSQSTRTTVRSTTTEYKNDPEINKIQYRWSNTNWWAMQSKPKWEKNEKNMNQNKQETHLKLTCRCLFPLLSFSMLQLAKNTPKISVKQPWKHPLLCSLKPLCSLSLVLSLIRPSSLLSCLF